MTQVKQSSHLAAHKNSAESPVQESAERSPEPWNLADLTALSPLRRARAAKGLNRSLGNARVGQLMAAPARENRTGLPDQLKAGLEQLSGTDLSDVRVHHNSPKPAQLNAHAYAQGQDIHLGPGQEKHLPHEGWHAVQQMQGRVRPTLQTQGVAINDDEGLEREADVMGAKALQMRGPDRQASKGTGASGEGVQFDGLSPPAIPTAADASSPRSSVTQRLQGDEQDKFDAWFEENAGDLKDHAWLQKATAELTATKALAGPAITQVKPLIEVARKMSSGDLESAEAHLIAFAGKIDYTVQLPLRLRLICEAAVESEFDLAITMKGIEAKLSTVKERASAFEVKATKNLMVTRKEQAEQTSLVQMGWVTADEINKRVLGVEQMDQLVESRELGKIIFTSGVGGCLAVAAISKDKCFIAHFDPVQIAGMKKEKESGKGKQEEQENPETVKLVQSLTDRVGGELLVYLASPSLDADYIREFKSVLQTRGHKVAGEFTAKKLAINSGTGEVSTKFDPTGLPLQ